MKATTTVTTSSYYGTTNTKTSNEASMAAFISPQQMLKRLIPYANVQKDKQNLKPIRYETQQQVNSRNSLIAQIQSLQSELNNIHAEVIESQNLLNVRDSLYGQLDMLRDQRQHIESDIGYLENHLTSKEVRVNIKSNQGYREMNQRLRRRMHEVSDYIHKMQLQNRKIEQNINYTNMLNIQKNYRTQVNSSNNWIDNAYLDQRQREAGRIDGMIARLHAKQDEALQRVRRQEEEINLRNQMNRASFANSVMGASGAVRSYYSPAMDTSGGRRRFYSPEYRY